MANNKKKITELDLAPEVLATDVLAVEDLSTGITSKAPASAIAALAMNLNDNTSKTVKRPADGTDCNTLTATGFYYGWNFANQPFSGNWATIMVLNGQLDPNVISGGNVVDPQNITQIAFQGMDFTSGNGDGLKYSNKVYIRRYTWHPTGTWTAWTPLALHGNYNASTNPGAGDDYQSGYSVGSIWINTTANTVYFCVDETVNAAVWVQIPDVTTLQADIDQNTTDIATNAANIATNTADIATNAADIATNAAAIQDAEDLAVAMALAL